MADADPALPWAWEQLQGMVLEEIRKRVEELAEAERETRLGRGRHYWTQVLPAC